MATNPSLPTSLPPEFYGFFWDIDAKKLDPSKHSKYVINRLLDKGNLEAARWVLKHFPDDSIIETVKTTRDCSPKTVNFWAHYLHIPLEEIKCMQKPYQSMRKQHWPY